MSNDNKPTDEEIRDRIHDVTNVGRTRLRRETIIDGRRYYQTLDLPKIVCLCGSTRFYEEFQRVNYELTTLDNSIVLSVGFFMHSQAQAHGGDLGITEEQKEALDRLHLKKIDLADEIFVINKGRYVGSSTMSEIAYAVWKRKPIRWLEHPMGKADTPPSEGTEAWLMENRHEIGKCVAKHATNIGALRNVEQMVTLDQDMEGLGKKGDTVSMADIWDWAAVRGLEEGYHKTDG